MRATPCGPFKREKKKMRLTDDRFARLTAEYCGRPHYRATVSRIVQACADLDVPIRDARIRAFQIARESDLGESEARSTVSDAFYQILGPRTPRSGFPRGLVEGDEE